MLFDPFLSPYDGTAPRLAARARARPSAIDVVFCSHEHVDHLDVPSIGAIATASPGAMFVVPSPIVDMVTEAGRPARPRRRNAARRLRWTIGGLTVRAVPACHGVTMDDAYGFGETLSGRAGPLPRVRRRPGRRAHLSRRRHDPLRRHGGDARRRSAIDVALLPINGRDAEREGRGIVGNLDHREAAWLGSRIDAGVLVPMHYDLFARNLGFPGALVETVGREFPEVPVLVPGARPAVRLHDEAGERGVKALVYLGPGRMELQDAPDPTPGPGEVVIASRASSICGSDLHGFREASPRRIPPLIMGHETVGAIADGGRRVFPRSRVGERVVLKPIVSCGACRWCREGAINHCPTGRLVGRDLTGGFAERFAVPAARRRAVRRGRLGRGRRRSRAARERGARRVAGRRRAATASS